MALTVDRQQPRHYGDRDGRYWSVSQVVEVVVGPRTYPDGAAERGTDIHDIFALLLYHRAGQADYPVVPESYAGYIRSIEQWLDQHAPAPEAIERPCRHPQYPYAGTPDLVAKFRGRTMVIDLKTGRRDPAHLLQIEAYMRMLDLPYGGLLYASRYGTPAKLDIIKRSSRTWAAFICGLSILQWREAQ